MKRLLCTWILISALFVFITCDGQGGQIPAAADQNMIVVGERQMQKSLNCFIDYNSFSIEVAQLVYERLCERNTETWELEGRLAQSWSISPDKLTYTFMLNKNARWADGSPVTSADVIFTYDTIMNPENLTTVFRMFYEAAFERVYAPDDYTVVFQAKTPRWFNFVHASSFLVLPKHEFEGGDFNKDFNLMLPPGSGPYVIEDVEPERFIVLRKRPDYWAKELPQKQGMYNFERIKYKFILEDEIRLESLKKGDIDLMIPPTSKDWVEWTEEDPPYQVTQNWILTRKVYNYKPELYQGFHMNMRKKIFQDIRVRKALAYLLNIDLLNEKLMYDQYIPLYSYFPSFFNNDADLPRFNYNPEKARALLAAAGWNKVDSEGVLMNDQGKRFEIEFLYYTQSFEKHLTIYKEDCAKVGVRINLNLISIAAYRKRVFEDLEFDMVNIAWGVDPGTLFPSMEDGWKSDTADLPNTNNIVGYKNPELDVLIDSYLEEFDIDKRLEILKRMDLILARDVPVILLWYAPYTRVYYWNKFSTPPKILKKYTDSASEDSYLTNWEIDGSKLRALQEAVAGNSALPAEPVNVYYDEELEKQFGR
ncbi:MAG: ABC transporter substrate-binding protein [Spirochaetales bacterium]|nr:ABC transporter substrate-binding protein [Spirochaetales bacterium]